MATVVWSASAAHDLDDFISWLITNHSAQHASSFVDGIDGAVGRLEEHPDSGRIIPELERQNITKYREVLLPPWRVFYSNEPDRAITLAVIDGRRNIEDVLLRRNLR